MVSDVTASSELTDFQGWYGAEYLVDKTYRSWAEGARGSGIGESFTLVIKDDYRDTAIAGFALKNGYGDLDYYGKNNRVKSFRIYIDGAYTETIPVKDSINFEQYAFKTPVKIREIRFVIDGVYPGTDYDDTCVAELLLLEKIQSVDDFYKNILRMAGYPFEDGPTQYINHKPQVTAVRDVDSIVLLEYMPFDVSSDIFSYKIRGYHRQRK
jgi:hypothetical protein